MVSRAINDKFDLSNLLLFALETMRLLVQILILGRPTQSKLPS